MLMQTSKIFSLPRRLVSLIALITVAVSAGGSCLAQRGNPSLMAWNPVGPYGGDARSFAPDPKNPQHLYLGTTTSLVYQSSDGGKTWTRLAKLGDGTDLVVDSLFVDSNDPKTLVAGTWKVDARGGGIYISHDAGKIWTSVPDMAGQSVRALTQAPSDPEMYVAGTLSGVYRSSDGGRHWSEISPAGSTELHEIESVAIDPYDTKTIYAGTWHLPWKTSDGGAHWSSIKEGLIDDSDIFSIIIDPKAPTVVYASACSGIYKSDTAGRIFRKVQGIPSTARRTRVLMQDPDNGNVVYAGTTEGLYKTSDAGTNWVRLTGPDLIVNDVFVDPANDQHVLLATDRSGVLSSNDGGRSFEGTNQGFSQRQVQALLVDQKQPQTLYAGVLNDKMYGGVFVSHDDGVSWQQQADGLNGRDVFALAQSGGGTVYAGTNDGIEKLVSGTWQPDGDLLTRNSRRIAERVHGRRVYRTIDSERRSGAIQGRVNGLNLAGDGWYAATVNGVYRSTDGGTSWEAAALPQGDYLYVAALGSRVLAGTRHSLMSSTDAGHRWQPIPLPGNLSGVNALAVSADGADWVGGREGVFFSKDEGTTWEKVKNLPLGDIGGLNYDRQLGRVLISSPTSTTIFGVDAAGDRWKFWEPGWRVHEVLQEENRLVAASLFNGVVVQPTPNEIANTAAPMATVTPH